MKRAIRWVLRKQTESQDMIRHTSQVDRSVKAREIRPESRVSRLQEVVGSGEKPGKSGKQLESQEDSGKGREG